jgi:hypothetical protein
LESNLKGNAMTEYQNIAIGLLGLTHPEIYFSSRSQPGSPVQSASSTLELELELEPEPTPSREPDSSGTRSGAALSAIKFAFAALVTGSRAVPMGDNGQLTKELVAYGARLHRFTARQTHQNT